ncbi:hypothetical protein HDU81_001589 [Chytriomyces hyalinus]|nr:hypothetical protein HDU81_001589 [Chytriomyces hyalinus]
MVSVALELTKQHVAANTPTSSLIHSPLDPLMPSKQKLANPETSATTAVPPASPSRQEEPNTDGCTLLPESVEVAHESTTESLVAEQLPTILPDTEVVPASTASESSEPELSAALPVPESAVIKMAEKVEQLGAQVGNNTKLKRCKERMQACQAALDRLQEEIAAKIQLEKDLLQMERRRRSTLLQCAQLAKQLTIVQAARAAATTAAAAEVTTTAPADTTTAATTTPVLAATTTATISTALTATSTSIAPPQMELENQLAIVQTTRAAVAGTATPATETITTTTIITTSSATPTTFAAAEFTDSIKPQRELNNDANKDNTPDALRFRETLSVKFCYPLFLDFLHPCLLYLHTGHFSQLALWSSQRKSRAGILLVALELPLMPTMAMPGSRGPKKHVSSNPTSPALGLTFKSTITALNQEAPLTSGHEGYSPRQVFQDFNCLIASPFSRLRKAVEIVIAPNLYLDASKGSLATLELRVLFSFFLARSPARHFGTQCLECRTQE